MNGLMIGEDSWGLIGINAVANFSDKMTVALKSGTETSTTLAKAKQKGTDIPAISGTLIF